MRYYSKRRAPVLRRVSIPRQRFNTPRIKPDISRSERACKGKESQQAQLAGIGNIEYHRGGGTLPVGREIKRNSLMLTRIAGLLEDLPMRSRSWILAFAIMPFPFVLHAQNTAPHVVKYQATMSTVKYDFGVAEPVARLARATSWTPTPSICFGGAIQKPGDTLALVKGSDANPRMAQNG